MGRKYHKGRYKPKHPEKWASQDIVYRSSWELKFNKWCDNNPSVLKVASEKVVIPYFWEVDQQFHRYFVDYIIKVKTQSGEKTFLVEIKPYKEAEFWLTGKTPKKGRKKDSTWQQELLTLSKNKAKWIAATKFCKARGIEFKIITEKELFDG